MRLIRLTHSVTEKRIYVDFDKVTGIVYFKLYTILWLGDEYIMVDESSEQIAELVKQAKEV